MWKLNKILLIIVIIVFVGCVNFKKGNNAIVFEPHIKQYVDIYLANNEKLTSENNFIIVQGEISNNNELILNIIGEMQENLNPFLSNMKDSICFGHYKEFKVFVIENNHKVLKSKCNSVAPLIDSDEIIPIMYDGPFWSFRIQDGIIIDFSYQFCDLDSIIIERLKSIPIPSAKR